MFDLIIGAVLALAVIFILRRMKPAAEYRSYGYALIIAAVIYGVFALRAANATWLWIEAGGIVIFTIIAIAGLKFSPWLLATGWAAHVFWDVGLHIYIATPFVPEWYPIACITFDLIIAGYVLIQSKKWNIPGSFSIN